MAFDGFSTGTTIFVFAGALAAAVVLHLLRTQPRELRTVTTLFWKEASAATSPRRLLHRFREWLSFFLLLVTLALLIAAISHPLQQGAASGGRQIVFVIDGGMSMQAPVDETGVTRFDQAIREVKRGVAALSNRDRMGIVVVDPLPRVVLQLDEPPARAARVLDELSAVEMPSCMDSGVKLAGMMLADQASPMIVSVSDTVVEHISAADGIEEVSIPVGDPCGNAAILSVAYVPDGGIAEGSSLRVRLGAWGEKDVTIHVQARHEESARSLLDEEVAIEPNDVTDIMVPAIPAEGGKVTIQLEEPEGIAADNQLTVDVPAARGALVRIEGNVPPALRLALETLGCAVVEDGDSNGDGNDIRIRLVADGPDMKEGSRIHALPGCAWLEGVDFTDCFAGEGNAIDVAASLAEGVEPFLASGDAVLAAVDMRDEKAPALLLSESLVASDSRFASRPAFVLSLGRMLEAAGVMGHPVLSVPVLRTLRDPIWIGEMERGHTLVMPAGSRQASNLSVPHEQAEWLRKVAGDASMRWDRILLLCGLALLLVESVLHARGRIA